MTNHTIGRLQTLTSWSRIIHEHQESLSQSYLQKLVKSSPVLKAQVNLIGNYSRKILVQF